MMCISRRAFALAAPEVKGALAQQGADALGSTPPEFDAIVRSELRKWAKLTQDAGIKAE
jgi:tripartite-type tricarboxylate transporter receptor subunit TctC